MTKKEYILYKIYYGDTLVYLGRTTQALTQRLYGHFFKRPNMREIDVRLISKIEYAELSTEADMYLYEIYLINKLKPPLNRDDKAQDELTVELPLVEFKQYDCPFIEKWINEVIKRDILYNDARDRVRKITEEISKLKVKYHKNKELTEDEYWNRYEGLVNEKKKLLEIIKGPKH